MDLHVVAPLPSPAERAAVDAVLGPASSGWEGGARDARVDGHVARGGHAARERRDMLLPALHAVQARIGWISEPALGYICRRLTIPPAEAYGVATFYALLSTTPRPPAVAHLCDDLACRLSGGETIAEDLERILGPAGSPARDGRMTWLRSPCLGLCERAPAALFTIAGERPLTTVAAPVEAVGIARRLEAWAGGAPERPPTPPRPRTNGHDDLADGDLDPSPFARPRSLLRSVPQLGDPSLRLIGRLGRADPTDLEAYESSGGYAGLRRALELGPGRTLDEIVASRLVGRGGAAFPTGRKWEAVASQAETPHHLVCNADESEPGTFKDRLLLEGDPFAVLEGMTIAAFVTGCERGYVYLRGEYPGARQRLTRAIEVARAAGRLGPDILGSGFSFEVEIRQGAGAYICGEETALFESIEGRRGEPRNKPPYPVTSGLFGRPTVVNNVETLVNVPLILREGGAAYAAIGTPGSTGPKLFCLSGNVTRPGLYEVPFGATLRDLLALAGGVADGAELGAILLGGAAGTFVGPDELDVPLTFEGTRAIGAGLGSGVVMVFDAWVDLMDVLVRVAAFFRDESCGQCVPCRVGTVRQEELLRRVASGAPLGSKAQELALLRELGQAMRDASICGLGQTASAAVESAVRRGLVPALAEGDAR